MNYEKELEKAKLHAEKVRLRQELNEVRHANDGKNRPLSFSKVAVIFIFLNCFVIEIYSMVVMFIFHDLSSLGSLVMAVIGQCASLLGYFVKAKTENCIGGITYETTIRGLSNELDEDDGAVG